MNKIYIVEYYGGEWEDKWQQILGVFNSLELAKKAEQDLLFKLNEIKKNAPLYPTGNEPDEIYDEMFCKHHEYWAHNYIYEEFAGTKIEEFELNKVEIYG